MLVWSSYSTKIPPFLEQVGKLRIITVLTRNKGESIQGAKVTDKTKEIKNNGGTKAERKQCTETMQ